MVKSIFYTKVDKMITAIIRSLFLKYEKFFLFVYRREIQHRALVPKKIENGPFLVKNDPKLALLAQNAQK